MDIQYEMRLQVVNCFNNSFYRFGTFSGIWIHKHIEETILLEIWFHIKMFHVFGGRIESESPLEAEVA